MSTTMKHAGTLGIYDAVDAATETIEALREAGMKRITVFSPVPSHELEHALHAGESPVRMFTLVGGLTGAATGFAMPTWMSMDWPLITGGKPIISIPAWIIIAFELTILFGALSTVAGLFISARLPQRRIMQVYDPSFSSDRFGILVVPPLGKENQVRDIMQANGAAEIREQVQEVKVGDL
jgi:hypothetical protein